jgi:hypothetical protein
VSNSPHTDNCTKYSYSQILCRKSPLSPISFLFQAAYGMTEISIVFLSTPEDTLEQTTGTVGCALGHIEVNYKIPIMERLLTLYALILVVSATFLITLLDNGFQQQTFHILSFSEISPCPNHSGRLCDLVVIVPGC